MDSLRPRYRGGRPRRITTDSASGSSPWPVPVPTPGGPVDALVAAAAVGLPRRRGDRGLAAASGRAAGRGRSLLPAHPHLEGQPRPRLRPKAARILALCEEPPPDGGVVSFDQMGPVSLRPTAGAGWAPQGTARAPASRLQPPRGHPLRVRRLRRPRRPPAHQAAAEAGRQRHARVHAPDPARLPARLRIYWIQDNLSANWVPDDPRLRGREPDRARRRPRPTPAT